MQKLVANLRNHFLMGMSLAICLLISACSSKPEPLTQVSPPEVTVTASTLTPPPSIDFTEKKASRPWRIAFVPKF